MEDMPNIYLRHLQERLGDIAWQLTRVRFGSIRLQDSWCPAINCYRCRDCILLCVDLAGVDRADLTVKVEPRRIWLRGQRQPPEPDADAGPPLQILALEIDHGPFEREIGLPEEVDPDRAQAEQRNGMLWLELPLRGSSP